MPKIDQLWAFVVDDAGPDDEGVISWGFVPMIGADQDRMASLRPRAQQIADSTRKPVKLVTFSNRAEIATLMPYGGQRNGH